MADLKTKYLGLDLKNPIIAAASGITGDLNGVLLCEQNGAGAIVLKSMFEEIIQAQSSELDSEMLKYDHPEVFNFIEAEIGMQLGSKPYLTFVEQAKNKCSVPIIASVNCVSSKRWGSYARDIESTGADALELNISHFPGVSSAGDDKIIKEYGEIVSDVAAKIKIPVSVKLGYNFTNIWKVVEEVVNGGAKGLVLFNRYYSVDVDIAQRKFVPSMTFSSPQEMSLPLRWTGLLYGTVNCSLAGNSGIHNGESALKMLMAGADAVQICSALYIKGVTYLAEMVKEISDWLDNHGYSSVSEIRGIACKNPDEKNSLLKRLQYVKALHEASKYEF